MNVLYNFSHHLNNAAVKGTIIELLELHLMQPTTGYKKKKKTLLFYGSLNNRVFLATTTKKKRTTLIIR